MEFVEFRLIKPPTLEEVMPDVQSWQIAPVFCDVGGVDITYDSDTDVARYIIDQLDKDRVVELQVYVDGVYMRDLDCMIEEYDGSLLEETGNWKFTGRTVAAVLDWGVLGPRPSGNIPDPGTLRVTDGTAGKYIGVLLGEAKDRGALMDFQSDNWDAIHDSNGQPWQWRISLDIAVGQTVLEVLNALVNYQICEYEVLGSMNSPGTKYLRLYNPGTLGKDRSVGESAVVLRQARDLVDSPRKRSTRDMGSYVLGVGGEGAFSDHNDPSAQARIGRRREITLSQGNTSDKLSLMALLALQAPLKTVGRLENSVGLALTDPASPTPGRDFFCGDWILLDSDSSGRVKPERLRVRQYTLTGDVNSMFDAAVTLNDKFAESVENLSKRIDGIVGGTTVAGRSKATPTTPGDLIDGMPPAAPGYLTLSSLPYLNESNLPRSVLMGTWPAVVNNADGSETNDVDHYDFEWALDEPAPVAKPTVEEPEPPVKEPVLKRYAKTFYDVSNAVRILKDAGTVAKMYEAISPVAADYGVNIFIGDLPGNYGSLYWAAAPTQELRPSLISLMEQMAKYPREMFGSLALETIRVVGTMTDGGPIGSPNVFGYPAGLVTSDRKHLFISARNEAFNPETDDEAAYWAQDQFKHTFNHEFMHAFHLDPAKNADWNANFAGRWNAIGPAYNPDLPYSENPPGFISMYAATAANEDIAETAAFLVTRAGEFSYAVTRYNADAQVKAKVDLIDQFITKYYPELSANLSTALKIERGTRDVRPRDSWENAGSTKDTRFEISELPQDTWVKARVRAVDRSGNIGLWRESLMHKTESDSTPPVQPSKPICSNFLGVISVKWDGNDINGVTMVRDFDYVDVYWSELAVFTPAQGTKLGRIMGFSAGGLVLIDTEPNKTYYFRFVAVDNNGNESEPSAISSAKAEPVVVNDWGNIIIRAGQLADEAVIAGNLAAGAIDDPDLIVDELIGSAKIRKLAVGSAQIADLAVNNAKIASAAVGTANIRDAAIVEAKMGNAAITNAKIANLAVNDAKVQELGVGKLAAGYMAAEMIVSGTISTSKNQDNALTMNTSGIFGYKNGVAWIKFNEGANSYYLRGDLQATTFRTVGYMTGGAGYIEMGNTGTTDPTDEIRMFMGSTVSSIRNSSDRPGSIRFSMNEAGSGRQVVDMGNVALTVPNRYTWRNARSDGFRTWYMQEWDSHVWGVNIAANFATQMMRLMPVNTSQANMLLKIETPSGAGAALKWLGYENSMQIRNAQDTAYADIKLRNIYADNIGTSSNPDLKDNLTELSVNALELIDPINMWVWDWKEEAERSGVGIGVRLDELPQILTSDTDDNDTFSLVSSIALLFQAAKQLRSENAELRTRMDGLEGRLAPQTTQEGN